MFLSRELQEAGKRLSDTINEIVTTQNAWDIRHHFLAIRLSDGSWDNNIYDSMSDAKRHSDAMRCCYVAIGNCLGGMSPKDCAAFLNFHRSARNASMGQKDDNTVPIMSYLAQKKFSEGVAK